MKRQYYNPLYRVFLLLMFCVIYGTPNFCQTVAPPQAYILKQDAPSSQTVQCGETPEGIDACSWASIQEQIKMGKYKAHSDDDGGYKTANPANGFHIAYGADGKTLLRPYEQGGTDYHIGMQLIGLGYADLEVLDAPDRLHVETIGQASGSKVTYAWTEKITEWWVNRQNSLEQWFYLKEAPQGRIADEPLRLRMALDTDMDTDVKSDRLAFRKADRTISYDKFKAWDATGKSLEVHFKQDGAHLDLVIADQDAAYPLTIDPTFSQQAYIKASNTGADDYFGYSVAISGETIVVGAEREDSNAVGVNGDETDDSAQDAGAAYVFVRSGTTWTQQAYLKASNTDANDRFGRNVAISGETIVVGAFGEDSNATGVNGDQTDNSMFGSPSGAAYVFIRSGTIWTQQAYLKASNTGSSFGDSFGWSVGISGETIVVGAHFEDSNATGINGNETDDSAQDAGAAYVFVRSGTVWTQQAYLKASNTDAGDYFGESIAISGETIVVSTYNEKSNATGVNGDQTDNSFSSAGAAYVFVRNGTTWTQEAYLKASNTDAGDIFGAHIVISGETIVVGARREDSNATGVNGIETNNSTPNSGAAYVFVRSGTTWTQEAYLKASNTGADQFGISVGISGETIVVGAYVEGSNATGVNGDESNNSFSAAGAAYVFVRNGTTWTQEAYLKASNTGANDLFGVSVAISDGITVVSSIEEDSNATGVNGDGANNSANGSGAVYVFEGSISIDLKVEANPVTQTANAGEFMTYTFTLTNESTETATGVKARVLIPSNTEFVSAIPSLGSYDANTLVWEVGTVPPGTETISLTVKVK